MNGYWGAIGLVVVGAVSVMATSDGHTVYKSEGEYIAQCTSGIAVVVPRSDAASACKCVYRSALPMVEARGDVEMTDSEAEMFYDKCLGPIYARIDAEAAWNADARYSTSDEVDGGWGNEIEGGSDWAE